MQLRRCNNINNLKMELKKDKGKFTVDGKQMKDLSVQDHSDKKVKCEDCNEKFALNILLLQHKLFRLINYNLDDEYFKCKRTKSNIKRIKLSSLPDDIHDVVYSSDSDCDYEINTTIKKIPNTKRKGNKTVAPDKMVLIKNNSVNYDDMIGELIEVNSNCTNDLTILKEESDYEKLVLSNNQNNAANVKYYNCEQCDNPFSTLMALRVHVSKAHNKFKMKKCPKCDKEFLKLSDLSKHKQTHTNVFLCNICGKSVKDSFRLTEHMRVHNDLRPFMCKICNKPFKYTNSLRLHMEKHENLQKYVCTHENCYKKFNYRSGLTQHIKVMHMPKAYQCKICFKNYTTKNHMEQHLHLHTGERPYKCEYCNKVFRLQTSLKIHVRTHTGEKPHECQNCKKSFAKLFNLKVHLNAKNSCAARLRRQPELKFIENK